MNATGAWQGGYYILKEWCKTPPLQPPGNEWLLYMMTQTPVKQVKQWLMVIAHNKEDSCYINGVKLFMKNWPNKTPGAIKRLCRQLKEVVESDEQFALYVFGAGATSFFKTLDIERIKW